MKDSASDPAAGKGLAFLVLMLGAVAISIGPTLVRVSEAGPVAVGFWRMFIPLPLQLFLMWRTDKAPVEAKWRNQLMYAGLFFGADLACWHVAIHYTSVANASLLANVMPLFVTLYVWLFRGERFNRLYLLGLGISFSGILTLMGPGFEHFGGSRSIGDALGIAAAVTYCGYFLIISAARRHVSAIAAMFWAGVSGSALLLPLALVMGEKIIPDTGFGWAVLFGVALTNQIIGQFLIAWALQKLHPAIGAAGLLVQPVSAAIIAAVFIGEPIGWSEIFGGFFVLSGIALVQWSERLKTKAAVGA